MLIEKYLLRLALRRNFKALGKEVIGNTPIGIGQRPPLFNGIPDIEVAAATIHTIIEDDEGFDRYKVAHRLLEFMRCALAHEDQQLENLFDHVIYYTKMLHLLSTIGNDATENVTKLLRDYFPSVHENEQVLSSSISQAVYSELRTYVLEILLDGRRSVHFAKDKFPEDFSNLPRKLRKVFAKLSAQWRLRFGSCELMEPVNSLSKEAQLNPAILLYYEKFSKRGIPNEKVSEGELIRFLQQIRLSQLSIVAPAELILPTPNMEKSLNIRAADTNGTATGPCNSESQDGTQGGTVTSTNAGADNECINGSYDLFGSGGNQQNSEGAASATNNIAMLDLPVEGIAKVFDIHGKVVAVTPSDWYCVVAIERMNCETNKTSGKRALIEPEEGEPYALRKHRKHV